MFFYLNRGNFLSLKWETILEDRWTMCWPSTWRCGKETDYPRTLDLETSTLRRDHRGRLTLGIQQLVSVWFPTQFGVLVYSSFLWLPRSAAFFAFEVSFGVECQFNIRDTRSWNVQYISWVFSVTAINLHFSPPSLINIFWRLIRCQRSHALQLKNLYTSVAVSPNPVRVPSQRCPECRVCRLMI